MKKALKISIGFIIFIFALIIAVPFIFKEDIKALLLVEFEKQVDATLYFENINLSLLRDFPDFTLGINQMGIVGKGVFAEDTLFKANELTTTIDLQEVLFGEQLNLKSITADHAFIEILVLADGTANYDIAKPVEATPVEDEDLNEGVAFGLESISLSNSNFIYYDASLSFYTVLTDINLTGQGAFANDVFDLTTVGEVSDVIINYEDVTYLSQKSISLDAVLAMDLIQSKYTFKENEISINTFPLSADGYFTLLENGYEMDIKFNAPGATFKELVSLIPSVYSSAFESLEAEGQVSFNGYVKGQYNDEGAMPSFSLNCIVSDGLFHYPDLPESIRNVNLNLQVDNADGVIENTSLNLSKFHLELGDNPLDARLKVENLKTFDLDAYLKASLDLGQIQNYYPVEGYEMKGTLTIDASAKGRYDSLKKQVPAMNILADLKNGYFLTPEISEPINNIHLQTSIINTTERLQDTEINIQPLQMEFAGQPFELRATLKDPENLSWDVKANGVIDLERMLMLFPQEDMAISGILSANIVGKGDMESLTKENYRNLPTSGTLQVTDFSYESPDFEKNIRISKANVSLNNDRIEVQSLQGKAGDTNYELEGFLYNYLGYALNKQVLKGELKAKADLINVNDWYVPSEEEAPTAEENEPLEVVRLPENIDFTMSANVGSIKYNQLTMNKVQGQVRLAEGAARLQNTSFQAMTGRIGLKGTYDSKPEKPVFDLNFNAQDISIPQSFQSLSMIKSFAPITEMMTGSFSTDFSLNGLLSSNMIPEMSSITGSGLIEVLQASLGETQLLAGLSSVTKLNNITASTLKKLKMSAEIKDGRLFVQPFDVNLGNYKTQVSGSTGIDGSIDYLLKMEVPAGAVGQQVNALVASLTGSNQSLTGENLMMNVGMSGVFNQPIFALKGISTQDGSSVKNSVQTAVSAEVEQQKEALKAQVNDQLETGKDSAKALLKTKTDSLQGRIDTLINTQKDSLSTIALEKLGLKKDSSKAVDQAKEKVEGILKGVFGKKKKKGEGGGL